MFVGLNFQTCLKLYSVFKTKTTTKNASATTKIQRHHMLSVEKLTINWWLVLSGNAGGLLFSGKCMNSAMDWLCAVRNRFPRTFPIFHATKKNNNTNSDNKSPAIITAEKGHYLLVHLAPHAASSMWLTRGLRILNVLCKMYTACVAPAKWMWKIFNYKYLN